MEPQERIGLASLTKMAFDGADLTPLRTQLLSQCQTETDAEAAFMDLSVIDQLYGNREQGLVWQAKALKRSRLYSTNRRTDDQPKLLVFAETGPMGANTPIEFLLQNTDFEILTYYPNFEGNTGTTTLPLPEHDIAFCAAPADSHQAETFFANIRRLTEKSGTKTLNLPDTPVNLDRDQLDQIFAYVSGLRVPKTTRLTRDTLVQALINEQEDTLLAPLGTYPYILRPCGSHAGAGLAKIDSKDALITYLIDRTDSDFFASEFIDYASALDGQYRKYRVVFVDGKPFPCHMAIADQWDLWYLNAGMDKSNAKRRDEARFMDHFERDFAARHRQSLAALTEGIGLDYFGIDCAEDADGNLVVFEADNALIVHDMDSQAVFPYKHPHMQRIFDAFETMLRDQASASTGTPDPRPARPHA